MSWLAAYREESSSRYKYMRLSPGSALQQQKDYTKFETARKLGFKVENIIVMGWSIGGYTSTWLAMNYPEIKGLVSHT